MVVSIQVEFEVKGSEGDISKEQAQEAAEQAAFDYLSFVEVSGVSTDSDEVVVHVDGYGKATVRLPNGESDE